ncbi:MAG TPA: RNA polymerase sigma factor [Candidatus Dormibacteraeota bacterium]|jgi:RNA polymerase sigma-70 factor (ECF subfamily)
MDEDELVERCRSGDGEAFRVLLERHQAMLFGLAHRITGHREDAMDALQDSCIKAWSAIGSHRGGSFRSWMSTIVARTCLDRVRARKNVTPLQDDDGVIPLPDPAPGPEGRALARMRVRLIEASLAQLSPDHRAIVLMRDLGGLSYEEIADGLAVPVGTVRSRLARARVALQQELLRRDPDILEALA